MMGQGQRLSETMIIQIRQLRQSGRSIREIALITGVNKNSVEKYVNFGNSRKKALNFGTQSQYGVGDDSPEPEAENAENVDENAVDRPETTARRVAG